MRNDEGVSIVIPCRNEKQYIARCLDSLIANDYPKEKLEMLVVDGSSEDGTRSIIESYTQKFSFIHFVDNPQKSIPAGMNLGIQKAKGNIILKADVHTTYQENYISKCVEALERRNVDNVGGVLETKPGDDTLIGKAIAIALSHQFGVGSSPFRRTGAKDERLVDTVAFGCYKKEVFDRIGLYNEKLHRSSDMELNIRLRKAGGKILLVPDIVAYYYADATLKDFFLHNIKDGVWATYPIKLTKTLFLPRHLIPLMFILIAGGLILLSFVWYQLVFVVSLMIAGYIAGSLIFSLHISVKQRDIRYLFLMPLVFGIRHGGYGLGSVWGAIKIFL